MALQVALHVFGLASVFSFHETGLAHHAELDFLLREQTNSSKSEVLCHRPTKQQESTATGESSGTLQQLKRVQHG